MIRLHSMTPPPMLPLRQPNLSQATRLRLVQKNLIPRRPWQRFQWRLTLLYLIATVLTILMIQSDISVYQIYIYVYSSCMPDEALQAMAGAEPAAARFFTDSGVDVGGLTRFLDQQRLDKGFPGAGLIHGNEAPGKSYIVVARPDGSILTATPDTEAFPGGADLSSLCTPEERRLVERARRGEKAAIRSAGRILAAAPLRRNGALVTIGFVRSGQHYTLRNALLGSAASLLTNALVTAVGGAIIGGLFGFLTARSLNRRIENISAAAERWAAGNLRAAAPEQPADEFGMLGRHLNRMAADLEQVISLRRRVAALEERQKVTRDLHDTVKQQAFATAMLVGSAQARLEIGDTAGVRESLNQAEGLAHGMQEELRSILKEYRATLALPIAETLERLTSDWAQQVGISISLTAAPESANLTPAISEEVAHIVQEALANAARHSGATHVDVILARDSEGWHLTVADNGHGFELGTEFGTGLGLQTMRERAEELPEGRFTIAAAPQAGTCIDVTFQEARKS